MAKPYGKRTSQGMRNLRSASWTAAKFTGRTTEKAAVGLFRWAATDHTGMSKAIVSMPPMGFIATIEFLFQQFIYAVAGSVLTAAIAYVMIAYGMPLFLSLMFG